MPVHKVLGQYKLLLDTHVWIWLMRGDKKLSVSFIRSLEKRKEKGGLFVSAISIWELGMLVERGKIELEMDCLDWAEQALATSDIELLPLTPRIAIESARLPENSHGDPADRILISTAREHHAILVTHDRKILDYGRGKFIKVHDPC